MLHFISFFCERIPTNKIFTMCKAVMDDFKFNPYKVLDLPKNSSDNEIKRRYRKLVKQYHPDKYEGENKDNSRKIFEDIEKAYQLLITSDPNKKYKVELDFNELKEGFIEDVNNNSQVKKPEKNPVMTVDKEKLKVEDFNYDPEFINKLQKNRDNDIFNINPVLDNNNFEQSIFNQLFDHNKKQKSEIIKYKKPSKFLSKCTITNDQSYADWNCYDDMIENPDPVSVDINRFTQDDNVIKVDKMDLDSFEKQIDKYNKNLKEGLTLSSDLYETNDKTFFDLW